MADKSFDAVIIGGGNKALILAMYLAKYGKMEVGIFEERHELGGGWSTEEPAPGFMANTCSHVHVANYHLPVYQDIPEWEDYGARYAHTAAPIGIIYIEDQSCVLFYTAFDDSDPTQEKTAREIAKFSEKDAETYLKLWDKCEKYWRPALDRWCFTPAQPLGIPDAMDELMQNPDAGIDPAWMFMSPLQVYKDVFDSPTLQHAFARALQSVRFQSDLAGAGLGTLLFIFYDYLHLCYVVGGKHQLAHASQRVILENGGKVFTKHPVKNIIIENGKAKGVRLEDGSRVEAKKLVVSSTDPYQLCFELVGEEYLNSRILKRVGNLEKHWIAIAWYTWALKERPRYIAESFNPDCWKTQWLVLGDRDLNTFVLESAERKAGKWPSKVNIGASYHGGSGDHLLAPPGTDFTILTEQFVLSADEMTDKEWKIWERRHAEQVIDTWQKYAPNMTPGIM
ncbi:MAG: NAD(P)-binding protein [Thermodesulfobacteriota bacterium]|nr:NAD(P)-binding protein [Thermodesulfobacteriota bacterium]